MKKSYIFALCLFVGVVLVLTGCGKSAAEKAAEKLAESATNGQADVDISDNTVTVNTNAGSWTAGEEVSLPTGFPSDIYIIDGTIKVATTIKENESYTISIETDKSLTEAKTEYENEMAADGWTSTFSLAATETVSLAYEKDNRLVNITMAKTDEGKTQVAIGTSLKEETENTNQE